MNDKNASQPQKSEQANPGWTRYMWLLLLWFFILYAFWALGSPTNGMNISYTDFKHNVEQGKVAEVTIKGDTVVGTFKEPVKTGGQGSGMTQKQFSTTIPTLTGPGLLDLLEKNNVAIKAESDARPWFMTLLIGLLPWVLIIGFFVYSSRRLREMGGMGGGGPFGFGRSRAKLYEKSSSNVTFKDVAGLDNAKKELSEIAEFLKNPRKFRSLGGKLPKGVLLAGPPGTGKTLMARAVAGEANVPFYSISGSEFIEMFVGVGASRVRDMFSNAKKDAPSIIFIDELDSIGRVRGTGLGGGHDEREQTLNQILAEMDGFSPNESVIVMAATNRPDILDPALIRPGRFDRRVMLDLPQKRARRDILRIHTRNVPLGTGVNLDRLADMTVGFSGADLENLVNEAALLAARKNKKSVDGEDFYESRDKILLGIEREEVMNEKEKRLVAYHEAGHALMAKFLPNVDPLQKVTIIPRGRALGVTEQIPEEDRHTLSRSYLLSRIAIMLGGRVAEKIVFNDTMTGAGDDLKKATQLARRMVSQWGMSEKLGSVAFKQGEEHPFLGREITEPRDFSEYTARIIDDEVRRIIDEMEEKAEEILKPNRDKLDALAKALMEHETLDNDEVNQILGLEDINGQAKETGPGDQVASTGYSDS